MIMYPLATLLQADIRDILIIVAPDHAGDYLHLLGSGRQWGAKFTYEIQDKPAGLAEAFIIGSEFIGDDNVTMILGEIYLPMIFHLPLNHLRVARIFLQKSA